MYFSPLEQFTVDPKFVIIFCDYYSFALTSFSVFLLINIFYLRIFNYFIINDKLINDNNYFSQMFNIFSFFDRMAQDMIGGKEGNKHLILIITIFVYLLFMNIMGLVPFTQTITSHFEITLFLSISLFLSLNFYGLILNKSNFLDIFLHAGSSKFISPILSLIEFISYLFRPLSLGIRLFINVMAGHLLIKILTGFLVVFIQTSLLVLIIPELILFLIISFFFLLELLISALQAYVFTLLICMYINDSINIH